MLKKLYIKNYALIDEAEIEFGLGMNILTGETGAGKSILLGALGLILGDRLNYSAIFDAQKKCIVEAIFVNIPDAALKTLKQQDIFDCDDNEFILRREASANGKSRAFINDSPVSLTDLKATASLLVDLHGQHANQALLSKKEQVRLLDEYAQTQELAAHFKLKRKELLDKIAELHTLQTQKEELQQRRDYINFQFEELSSAHLNPEVDNEVESRLNTVLHSAVLTESLNAADTALYEDDNSIYNQLSSIISELDKVEKYLSQLGPAKNQLVESQITIQELAHNFREWASDLEWDPGEKETLESRQNVINKLKLKFSVDSIEDLLKIQEEFENELQKTQNVDALQTKLNSEIERQKKELLEMGLTLEQKRQAAISPICDKVNASLKHLGFKEAEFIIVLSRNLTQNGLTIDEKGQIEPLESGINQIQFLIRTNPGRPHGPISNIASGGELSRITLSIKAAMAEKAELSVLIFDEIDAGIGGKIGSRVGELMRNISKKYQLICITHLPQIAAKGNQHFRIFKKVEGGSAFTRIAKLAPTERIMEIASMIGGDSPTESALQSAKEMLSD